MKNLTTRTARALRGLLMILWLPLLGACVSVMPPVQHSGEQPEARALLEASAQAHGVTAFRQLRDVNVSYEGQWRYLVQKLQPVLVDADFRKTSEERLLLGRERIIGQRHSGPGGVKHVVRQAASVEVQYNGQPSRDRDVLAAAALVADAYGMFLTGPMYFLEGNASLALAGTDVVEGRACDLLLAVRRPGHGPSAEDRYLLFIDRQDRLLRRVRFTMEGLAATQGAVVEVDFFDHREIAGVRWPTRFFERIRKPIPMLPVHAWRLTGLDVNRGYAASAISGGNFSGRASDPARVLE
jgi:hypothetical protein